MRFFKKGVTLPLIYLFIHSRDFYSAYSRPLYYSEALPTQHGYCVGVSRRSALATASEGLAQGPYTWRLERDSDPRPFGRKASNLPMNHHAPHVPWSKVIKILIAYNICLCLASA